MYNIKSSLDMGRVIAFWSPIHRQGAVSTTTALLASFISEKHINKDIKFTRESNNDVLLMSNELYGAPTAATYMIKDTIPDGLTEVVHLSKSDNLKSDTSIYNNTYSGVLGVDILASSKRNGNIEDYIALEIPNIFNVARTGYKYILVDTVPGTSNESTLAILRNCDIIVVCMPQDRMTFDNWIRKMPGVYISEVEKKPTIVISEMHYEYKHMTYSSMATELKDNLYYISLNDVVHKAVSERSVASTIKELCKVKSKDDVIYELSAIYDTILEYIDTIVNKELQKENEIDEENDQRTQEYLENINNLFSDNDYEDYNTDDKSNTGVESSNMLSMFTEDEQADEETDTSDLMDMFNKDDDTSDVKDSYRSEDTSNIN